jgi:hypothetical protein
LKFYIYSAAFFIIFIILQWLRAAKGQHFVWRFRTLPWGRC